MMAIGLLLSLQYSIFLSSLVVAALWEIIYSEMIIKKFLYIVEKVCGWVAMQKFSRSASVISIKRNIGHNTVELFQTRPPGDMLTSNRRRCFFQIMRTCVKWNIFLIFLQYVSAHLVNSLKNCPLLFIKDEDFLRNYKSISIQI